MPYLAQLDLTRARGLGAAPSRPKGCVYPVTGQLAGPGAYLDWARRTATTLATRAGVRVQNMHPQAWVAHIEGILRNQLGANPWVALQYTKHPGKKADFWWGRALLRELAHHAKRPAPELSA